MLAGGQEASLRLTSDPEPDLDPSGSLALRLRRSTARLSSAPPFSFLHLSAQTLALKRSSTAGASSPSRPPMEDKTVPRP